jgi:hypothetical protein
MNWKGHGRKWSWPNLRYYPGIFLEGLRKNMKELVIAILHADILIQDIPNTKQKCQPLRCKTGWFTVVEC